MAVGVEAQLNRDEARRKFPYMDCCGKPWRECTCDPKGKLTIGVGRNLDDDGISDSEIDTLLGNDIAFVKAQLAVHLTWARSLDDVRYAVLIEMAFNMGIEGLMGFHEFLGAMHDHNWTEAAAQMRDSAWQAEVKERATRLEQQVLTGEWQ